jgi:hypothetical protein
MMVTEELEVTTTHQLLIRYGPTGSFGRGAHVFQAAGWHTEFAKQPLSNPAICLAGEVVECAQTSAADGVRLSGERPSECSPIA